MEDLACHCEAIDSRKLSSSEESSSKSSQATLCANIDNTKGNFWALLQIIVNCNDKVLLDHFNTAAKNATYISLALYNNIINAISTVIKQKIMHEIEANFFSLIADEITDFSTQKQLTICFRYIINDAIYECFFCFSIVTDFTGSGLAIEIINFVKALV